MRCSTEETALIPPNHDIARFQSVGHDLFESGVLFVHPGLEVLDERKAMHEALALLRRRVETKPHRTGHESLTGDLHSSGTKPLFHVF